MRTRSSSRRASRATVLLTVVARIAAACSSTTTSQSPTSAAASPPSAAASSGASASATSPSGGTLTAAFVGGCCGGVDYLYPIVSGGSQQFFHLIWETLVLYSIDPGTNGYGPIVPGLAASWSTSSDGMTWTFQLQPNATWHDGTPFTSADVAFSLAICLNPNAGGCSYAGGLRNIVGAAAVTSGTATTLSGVATPDAKTVTITTTNPDAGLLDALSNIFMVQESSVSKIPLDQINTSTSYWGAPGKVMGTGPFQIAKYEPGQFMQLDAYAGYWRGAPKLAHIIRPEFKDPATALLAFDNGQIDLTYLTADEVDREQPNTNARIIAGPSQVDNIIVFNPLADPAFANVQFRQAMQYAINRKAIVEAVLGGGGQLESCGFGNPAYHGLENTYPYDPDKAKQLLQEAGINMAALPTFTLETNDNDQVTLNIMTAIQQDWTAVGLNVKIQVFDGASGTKRLQEGQFQISFQARQNGPDGNIASTYFHSSSAWPKGGNGWKGYHYANPQVDQLSDQGTQTFDPNTRAQIYQKLCKVLADELPWNFLWEPTRYWIVSNKVGNFQLTPAPGGGSYYDAAEEWTINP